MADYQMLPVGRASSAHCTWPNVQRAGRGPPSPPVAAARDQKGHCREASEVPTSHHTYYSAEGVASGQVSPVYPQLHDAVGGHEHMFLWFSAGWRNMCPLSISLRPIVVSVRWGRGFRQPCGPHEAISHDKGIKNRSISPRCHYYLGKNRAPTLPDDRYFAVCGQTRVDPRPTVSI